MSGNPPTSGEQSNFDKSSTSLSKLSSLAQLTEPNQTADVCVRVKTVSGPLTSRSGWKYRLMKVEDPSMAGEVLISEPNYGEWKFKSDDYVACSVRSNGIDNTGRLSVFFNSFSGPFEVAKTLYEMGEELHALKSRSAEHMKPTETVYQISAREARSLLVLIRLWIVEGKPQHYTKWCQMHQIVATNLFYMGLVKRTGSMSGYYYPTEVALEFFEGKRGVVKRRVFTKGKDGQHVLSYDEGESRSFEQYLGDHGDRESALKEYAEALEVYQKRIKAETA
ncbi:MAG: hypothetical protein OK439_04840 [Thaumarchaeota archaeon]|nr:hypothetical protein [Nitrososphaerota archaeon]